MYHVLYCITFLNKCVFNIFKEKSSKRNISQTCDRDFQLRSDCNILFFFTARLDREAQMEEMIANQKFQIEFLESQYRSRQEDVLNLQVSV